jgi:chemotaxis protein MotB
MRLRRGKTGAGGHGSAWVVSFADLMSLLMAFFVMLLSFSIQDQEKLKQAAGSVQDAFGITPYSAQSGMIERAGNPQRSFLRNLGPTQTESETEFASVDHAENGTQGQEANTFVKTRTNIERAAQYALASASLKQAWKDLPDITEFSDHITMVDTEEGLNVVIADREGNPMFPPGSKYPFEITRKAIAAMAPALAKMPNRIRISGYTASGATYNNPRYGAWELSFDRANIARQILDESGFPADRVESVIGRADTDPLLINAPYLPGNQRVSIMLIYEKPPVPADLAP